MDDVVIAGAGPTGLALAAELFRRGHAPRVLDRQAAGANTSRAAVIHARTLEVLEPLGIVPALLGDGVKVPIFRVRDRHAVLAQIDFGTIASRYNFTLMCPQDVTERHLLARLAALGGSVTRPREVTALRAFDDRVEVVLGGDAAEEQIACRWVIGCDGAHSAVREAAGIGFSGGSYAESFVLADVHMDWPFGRSEVSLFVSADGLVVVAPLPGDRFRIVATMDSAPPDPPAAVFDALLRRRVAGWNDTISAMEWSSRFHIQHRVAQTPRKGRILLCGDAAHVHSPAGGQGMNTGIQDAMSLAAALDTVLRGGSDGALDDWARRRHAVAMDVVAMTDRMTRIATLRSAPARLVRNALMRMLGALPPVRAALARKLAELDN